MKAEVKRMRSRTFQGSTFNSKGEWADGFFNNNGMVNTKAKVAASCCQAPQQAEKEQEVDDG